MKKYFPVAKKSFSTLALACALIASTALALVNCADPAPPATFTVKFDTNGGTNADPQTVESGKKASKPTDPTKTDSTFAGWYKDKALTQAFDFNTEKITQNITLYAKWVTATYTVTFDTNGGTPNEGAKTVAHGERVQQPQPDPTKTDFTFAGWYKDRALTQAFNFSSDKITANTTLYAKWVPEGTVVTYTVTFDTNGGEPAIADKTIEAGKTLEKPSPDPTKTDSLFVGWYNDEALTQAFNFFADAITANTTLYAKWVPEHATATYTVTFNLNGGTPNEEDKTVAHGEKVQQPQPDPTKTDSLFAGWYKDEELTQRFPFSTERITQPITLYAKWESPTGVTIPDANFRARLKELISDAFEGEKLDVTSDEVTRRQGLSIADLGIKDLTGIEYFTALTRLYCSKNQLAALDVSKNTQLTVLYCTKNQLAALDVSANTALAELYCSRNQLVALDVSKNTALTELSCAYNRLTHLDVTGMRNVNFLSIQAASNATNVIDTLKVHENLKDHAQVSAVKTARGDKVKIETYSAAVKSTQYILVCSDYDPTVGSEADRCGDEVKYTVTFNSRGGSLVNPISLYREGPPLKTYKPHQGRLHLRRVVQRRSTHPSV